jgi:hypothetical protein
LFVCIVFSLHIFRNLCLMMTLRRKWSESILGPLSDLTSSIISFLLVFIKTWLIWWNVFWSGNTHVLLCNRFYSNCILMTIMLLIFAKSHNISPFLFVSSWSVCLPNILLYTFLFLIWHLHRLI